MLPPSISTTEVIDKNAKKRSLWSSKAMHIIFVIKMCMTLLLHINFVFLALPAVAALAACLVKQAAHAAMQLILNNGSYTIVLM